MRAKREWRERGENEERIERDQEKNNETIERE